MMIRVLRTSVICASLAALLAACGDAANDTTTSATDAVASIGAPTPMASPAPTGSLTPGLVTAADGAGLPSWTAVSYTHLPLPTSDLGEIPVAAG